MKNLYYDDFENFACDIADKFDELDTENFEDIAVIAKPNEIKEIFKELICIGYDICNITYERIDWDGYDDEYVLSMNHEGIWLEKFMRDGKYYEDESTVIYVLDNCSSKVIPYCKGKTIYEVAVGEEDCDCDECECACCKDEKPATTSTSSTTYKVNGKEVDKETHEKTLNELDEKYLDNVQDMLLNYFDFVSEMNQWRKLLGW